MARKSNYKRTQVMWVMVLPAIIYITVFLVYPLAQLLIASTQEWSLVRSDRGRTFIGLANYYRLFADPALGSSILKTIIFVIGVTASQIILGLGIAVLLNRGLKGEGAIRALALAPWFIPPVVVGFNWVFMFAPNFGILPYLLQLSGGGEMARYPILGNPVAAMAIVIFVHVWSGMPGIVLICTAGLKALPTDVYEAARVDGANGLRQFVYITVPMLWPVIMVATFLTVSFAVRAFDIIQIMTGGGPGSATEVLGLYQHSVGVKSFDIGYGSTLALVLILMALATSYFFLRGIVGRSNDR